MSSAIDPSAVKLTRWLALLVLVAGIGAFLVQGSSRPADPYLVAAGGLVPSTRLPGFDEVAFTVARGDGTVDNGTNRAYCGVLAATTAQQNRGLMNQRNLAGYAGMIFTFPAPTRTYFYMKDTLIPLSIAWFNRSGVFVGSADMTPCPPATVNCPLFRPGGPYRSAIEVPSGGLGALGIASGSILALNGQCIP